MKSAAFNLAFKVHRNELPFAEGILKSNEEGAAEDFLDALNSLAGEIRYDPAQLSSFLQQAQTGSAGPESAGPSPPAVDINALLEEVNALHKTKRELEEGIETLNSLANRKEPMIVPGINSVLLLIACSVFVALLFVFGQHLIGLILIVLGLGGAASIFTKDLRTLREQQAEVERKRALNEAEVNKLKELLAKNEEAITAKQADIQAVQGQNPTP